MADIPDETQHWTGRHPCPPRGVTGPSAASHRLMSWVATAVVGLTLAGAVGYVVVVAAFGVHTGRGWIDDQRRSVPALTQPFEPDNGLYTYLEAARAMESARVLTAAPKGGPGLPAGVTRSWDDVLTSVLSAGRGTRELRPLLEASGRVFALLHEAAGKPYVSRSQSDPRAGGSYHSKFRGLARLGAAQALWLRDDGRDAEALATARDVAALGVNVPRHGDLEDALVGDNCIGTAHRAAMRVLGESRLSADAYLAHADAVRALRLRLHPLGSTVALEHRRAEVCAGLVVREGFDGLRAAGAILATAQDAADAVARLTLWEPQESLEWLEDRYARTADVIDRPYWDPAFVRLEARTRTDLEQRRDWFSDLVMPGFAGARTSRAKAQCRLAIEEAAARVCACRAATGALPPTLEALVPRFARSVPLDPLSGDPLRYERTAAGFRVWSPEVDAGP